MKNKRSLVLVLVLLFLPGCRSLVEMRVDAMDLIDNRDDDKKLNTTIFIESCLPLKCKWVRARDVRVPIIDEINMDYVNTDYAIISTQRNTVLIYVNPSFITGLMNNSGLKEDSDITIQYVFTNDTNHVVNVYARGIWLNNKPIGLSGVIVAVQPGTSIRLKLSDISSRVLFEEYVEGVIVWKVV